MDAAEERFASIAMLPEEEIDLGEAALRIAQAEYAELDVAAYQRRLDDLAVEARGRVPNDADAIEAVARLNHFLFAEAGFRGNRENYQDPRNSYLNDVLDRRTGIPISLSLVYMETARRLGLPIVGVGFPGHFLVKHVGDPEILVDPFFGLVLSEEDCLRRLQAAQGREARLDPRYLAPASPHEILVRWLRNLKQIHLAQTDFTRALRWVSWILRLLPDEPRELRDRGSLFAELECFGAAVRDFERYLTLAPDDANAADVRARLPEIHRQAARLQ